MTIEDEVIRLASLVPREPGTSLPLGASRGAIKGFELIQEFPLPPEVVEWLECFDGPNIGPGGIYGLSEYKRAFKSLPEYKAQCWLPLGSDGCGDDYVLALNSVDLPLHPVYFIDPYASDGYAHPTYVVASGFWQFLQFLFQEELGERRWPFDAAYVLQVDPDLASIRSACLPWIEKE